MYKMFSYSYILQLIYKIKYRAVYDTSVFLNINTYTKRSYDIRTKYVV